MTQQLPPITRAAASLWAKSPRDGGALVPVLNHLLDVAACAAEILRLEPERTRKQMAADLGLNEAEGLPWVLVLIALHDLGKASPAFQVLWPEGANGVDANLPIDQGMYTQGMAKVPHGIVSQQTLPALLTEFLGWPTQLASDVADAVGAHHGFRNEATKENHAEIQLGVQTPDSADFGWDEVRAHLLQLCAVTIGADFEVTPTVPRLSAAGYMRLAGLTSFADWLGSSFKAPVQTDYSAYSDPAAYWEAAKAKAKATLQAVHWPEFVALGGTVPALAEVFGYVTAPQPFRPRPLQKLMAQALENVQHPTLCIVEAPMGDGKTEAALFAYLQLARQLQHRGMYIALPTQATGNAMYSRFADFLGRQGRQRPPSLQLAHGGTLLSEAYQKRLRDTREAHLAPVANLPTEEPDSVRAEEWFGERKRALLDEYGVGTVDQALLGVLGVSHQFVRLWGLGNRVVVLDEVHAYDTYTSELIAALVAWLRALGSSVILMSATLPQASRRNLLRAWGVDTLPEATYPRLTVAEAGQEAYAQTIPTDELSRPPQTILIKPLASEASALAGQAAQLVQNGGRVAVIVNTVQRAQQVFEAVKVALLEREMVAQTCTETPPKAQHGLTKVGVLLYHARYPADERLFREQKVLDYLGKGGKRPERFILIATQVAEQSLDFDADVMLTDLAPIDLVLQRAGRLHRHAKNDGNRFQHEQPTLYIAGLNEWPETALTQEYWGRVYQPALLYRSWAKLRESSQITLPDDLDNLVQDVYAAEFTSPELSAEQQETLSQAESKHRSKAEQDEQKGEGAHIGWPERFWVTPIRTRGEGDSVADDDEWLGTRLGEQSVRLVPVYRKEGTWWVCPTPAKRQDKERPQGDIKTCFATLPKGDTELATQIYRRSLNISQPEVVRLAQRLWDEETSQSLGNAEKKKGWRSHPLLRDAVPLDLTTGFKDLGKLRVHLHPELGLVYEKLS